MYAHLLHRDFWSKASIGAFARVCPLRQAAAFAAVLLVSLSALSSRAAYASDRNATGFRPFGVSGERVAVTGRAPTPSQVTPIPAVWKATAKSAPTGQPMGQVKSWGYQLRAIDPAAIAKSSYDVVVIDFANHGQPFTREEVERMRLKPDGGRRQILAYMSVGEAERYRFYWHPTWYLQPPAWLGPENEEWRGNYLVRYWDSDWQKVVFGSPGAYLDRILAAGFDGAYLDRIDVYAEWEKEKADAARLMKAFVAALSAYAKQRDPKFQIVAQNAEELLEDDDYLATLDAVAKEDLLHGVDHTDAANSSDDVSHSVALLQKARREGKTVFVVEYLCRREQIEQSRQRLTNLGFVPYFSARTLHRLGMAEDDYCQPLGPLGRRVALVIGNAAYQHAPRMTGPAEGAKLLAQALRSTGFSDVRERIDLSRDSLNHELQRFAETARGADWAVVAYSGLGLFFEGTNYLLPVGARLELPADVGREAVLLDDLVRTVEGASAVRLVLVDACRRNYLLEALQRRGMTQIAGPGITARPTPRRVVVGYGSRCDAPAAVVDDQPDPFVTALARHIPTAGLELPWLMERVRDSVLRASKGAQEPVHFGALPDSIAFVPAADDRKSSEQRASGPRAR